MDGRSLVGRDLEIAALDRAVDSAFSARRPLLFLSGEPGIGKTRLLESLAARIIERGGVAAWGRTREVGLTPAFWPWIQLLSALGADEPAPPLGALEASTDAAVRLARFAEVRAFLIRFASARPLALLIDDLHAADPSSLQLLEYLLPELVARRVLVALAARDTEGTNQARSALARIQRGAERLSLSRLTSTDVARLVGARADAQRVFELSEGNPLFVEELLSSQQSVGRLSLPALSSVRAVIRERVATLPPEARTALVAGSVLGREFRGLVAAGMLGTSEAAPLLAPAVALGMVAVTGPDRFRFSHALVAEALSEEVPAPELARLHLDAARALERHVADDAGSIAHHLLAAGHLAAEAAVSAAERAAAQCMAQLAFEDAAALLERALAAQALARADDARHRASLLCARAEALQHASQHGLAAELCDQAAASIRGFFPVDAGPAEPADSMLFARIALARGAEYRFGRTDPLLVAILSEALERLGDASTPLRARLMARLAAAEQPASDPRGPVARALQAVELASGLDARERLSVGYVATAALVDYVDPEQLERHHREVLELARGRDRWISVHTRFRLCFTALERIDRAGYDQAVQAFCAEALALGLPQWLRHTHTLSALTALLEGRFEVDEREAAASHAISAALGDSGARFLYDVHRAMAASVRTAKIPAELRETLAGYAPGRAAIAAWLAVQDGSPAAARAALGEIADEVCLDPDLMAMRCHAVAYVGSRAEAERLYRVLETRRLRPVLVLIVGAAVLDLHERLLLQLASRAERFAAIDGHAERAIAVAERLGSPVWRARVLADWADARQKRDAGEDRSFARALYAEALECAERLDMPGLAEHCRRSLGSSLAATPDGARAATPAKASLSIAREGELWRLSGLGETIHVKDSRGLGMIARLVESPGSPLHALELAGTSDAVDGGDAGAVLDRQARAEYRARLAGLARERDEAERLGDPGALERANRELEMLTAELERAFGLGGRERRVGVASERARSNVQRRISHGLEQIRAASSRLGEHLTATIRTGTYCVYSQK